MTGKIFGECLAIGGSVGWRWYGGREDFTLRSSDEVIFMKEGYMMVKQYGGILGTREECHILGKFLITEVLDSATS